MRRQATTSRLTPAGSSRDERLDPFALPLRFEAADHAADERVRLVELHRERVVLRRALHGIKMAVHLPLTVYLGVAIRIEPPTQATAGAVAIVLEHPDPDLSLTLYRADDGKGLRNDLNIRAIGELKLSVAVLGCLSEITVGLKVDENERANSHSDYGYLGYVR